MTPGKGKAFRETARAGLSVRPDAGGQQHGSVTPYESSASLAYATSMVSAGHEMLFLQLAERLKLLPQLSLYQPVQVS